MWLKVKRLTQEELEVNIQKLRSGDESCINPLTQHYACLATKIAGNMARNHTQRDDIQSEALVLLIKALRCLLSEFGKHPEQLTPINYIWQVIVRGVIKYLRKDHILNPSMRLNCSSLEDIDSDKVHTRSCIDKTIEFADILKRLNLDQRSIRLITLAGDGMTQEQIASELGVSQQYVSQLYTSIKQRAEQVKRLIHRGDFV